MALHVNNLIGFGAGGGAPAMPSFISASTGTQNTASGTLAINYPTSPLANDIIILVAVGRDANGTSAGDTTFTSYPNFTADSQLQHSAGKSETLIAWKRATGSETGTETVTMTSLGGTRSITGIMYLFRGCITTGTPFEAGASANVNSTATWTQTALTSSNAGRLGIHIIGHTASATGGNFTGETGGDFTETSIYTGTNATIDLQTASMPNATTISGGSVTASAAAIHGRRSFALLPVPA